MTDYAADRERAFEALFQANYAGLYRFACRLLGSTGEAEEVVQEVFMYVWDRHELIEDTTRVRKYLYRAVHNRAINRLRRQRTRRRLLTPDAVPQRGIVTPAQELERDELKRAIDRAIETLPARCRMVVTLRQENLSYQEIAETLDISVKTVENHLARGFRLLRQALADYLPGAVLLIAGLGR